MWEHRKDVSGEQSGGASELFIFKKTTPTTTETEETESLYSYKNIANKGLKVRFYYEHDSEYGDTAVYLLKYSRQPMSPLTFGKKM